MDEVSCGICQSPVENPNFARNYPNYVCRTCDRRAVNKHGNPPLHESAHDHGDNPIFIDGIKCWRRYRYGGYVTMRDDHDCADIGEFYSQHHVIF
jgi:hypothetical protein